ncbi:hypothetical protein HS99_0016435 [Kitasatospora aureofaciens]|uniref:Uncharacterized protein n=1 Tax=Kitasatospora aureofaciens TaxID=1894 RepID=A0A1E7MV46_KITAU|nr:hypothetical protein [Kitasatospora aureofaciens]OEV32298.1 hypothetical protein HS99_0016435 [Kitasatospora aureofaciens]
MRVATVRTGGAERLALVDPEGGALALPAADRRRPVGLAELLPAGPEAWAEFAERARSGPRLPFDEADLLAPLPRPRTTCSPWA